MGAILFGSGDTITPAVADKSEGDQKIGFLKAPFYAFSGLGVIGDV